MTPVNTSEQDVNFSSRKNLKIFGALETYGFFCCAFKDLSVNSISLNIDMFSQNFISPLLPFNYQDNLFSAFVSKSLNPISYALADVIQRNKNLFNITFPNPKYGGNSSAVRMFGCGQSAEPGRPEFDSQLPPLVHCRHC